MVVKSDNIDPVEMIQMFKEEKYYRSFVDTS